MHWNGLDKSGGQVDALNSAEYSGLEKRLCELLKENSKMTQSEIQKRLNISRSKVQRTMKKLVNEGVIDNIGSHRSAHWAVKM